MAKRLSVVVSQGQSNNPVKRKMEEDLVASLIFESGIDVTIVPHLYDLKPDGTGILALQGIGNDMVVLSWMYPRAAHWALDRNGIHGHEGVVLLKMDEDDEESDADAEADAKPRVIDERVIPNRKIYCIDFRASNESADFVDEIKRISREATTEVVALSLDSWISGEPTAEQRKRFDNPTNDTAVGAVAKPAQPSVFRPSNDFGPSEPIIEPIRIEESGGRRWYPVIDFSRCTNCMECIDFCLFGVYGVDGAETILVEQPDNCRKGCPACSRVCPENAIIFPQHKTPAIAGAQVDVAGLKIDLSKLFGAPETSESADEAAARERDEQLVLAGREAVGMSIGMPKRQEHKPIEPKDDLDDLIDALDDMDL